MSQCDRCGTDDPVDGVEIVRADKLAHRPDDELWCFVCRNMLPANGHGAAYQSKDAAVLVNIIRKDIRELRDHLHRIFPTNH